MIFDHIVLSVSDQIKSSLFYTAALSPLGITLIREDGRCSGYGTNGKPSFWICHDSVIQNPMHIAFVASDRASVDAFYEVALSSGGRDNGQPGIRAHYHANYYSAFVFDPDGHNIEAVCRKY